MEAIPFILSYDIVKWLDSSHLAKISKSQMFDYCIDWGRKMEGKQTSDITSMHIYQ